MGRSKGKSILGRGNSMTEDRGPDEEGVAGGEGGGWLWLRLS